MPQIISENPSSLGLRCWYLLKLNGTENNSSFRCADFLLCQVDSDGKTYINPTTRIALKAYCSDEDGSDCSETMLYDWQVKRGSNATEITGAAEYFPTGTDKIEMAMSQAFFQEFPEDMYHIGLSATNGLDSTGEKL